MRIINNNICFWGILKPLRVKITNSNWNLYVNFGRNSFINRPQVGGGDLRTETLAPEFHAKIFREKAPSPGDESSFWSKNFPAVGNYIYLVIFIVRISSKTYSQQSNSR
jgi:hypothetical protein